LRIGTYARYGIDRVPGLILALIVGKYLPRRCTTNRPSTKSKATPINGLTMLMLPMAKARNQDVVGAGGARHPTGILNVVGVKKR